MAERVISERVVSRKVVGSANPIARKFRDIKGAFQGVCIAPVLIVLAFGLLLYSERFKKSSQIVESLTLEQANEVTASDGMHKMSGTPTVSDPAVAPEVGSVLYYHYTLEEYKEVEETETETVTKVEGGKDIEETIERVKIVPKWVELESESKWASFKLGNYSVATSGADLELDLMEKEYYEDWDGYFEVTSGMNISPELGDYRMVVTYLELDSELLVVGQISNSTVDSSGEVFIISTKSDSELLADLKTEESAIYWVMKAGTVLLLMFGFLSILGPVLSVLDIIPIAGKALNCAATVIALILSVIIVAIATVIIKFWWAILILGVVTLAGIGIGVFLLLSKGSKKGQKKVKK
jgi:hypothetical protein